MADIVVEIIETNITGTVVDGDTIEATVSESTITATTLPFTRDALGLGTGDNPTFAGLILGGVENVIPLKLISGALLATPEAGALEYNGKFTITNNGRQKVIDRTSDVILSTTTVANTTAETIIWTGDMAANSVEIGNVFRFIADGIISSASAADKITMRIKVGGITKATLESEAKQLSDDCWHIRANATQRTLGVTGSRAMHIDLVIDEYATEVCAVGAIDTTINMDVTVTVQWNNAKAGNTISLYQGFMGYRN